MPQSVSTDRWWIRRREALLAIAADRAPCYVYDLEEAESAVRRISALGVFDRILYALKANAHAAVLARVANAGAGFDCSSQGELDRVLSVIPDLDPSRILFTPNFAPRVEYEQAFARGARVTVDGLHPLAEWPDLFRDREIFLRLDPGKGRGHHRHVRTGGHRSKFGIAAGQLDEAAALVRNAGARVAGLHAHSGSGILDPSAWSETAEFLTQAAERFPDVRVLDVGGGLGVPVRRSARPLDLEAFGAAMGSVRAAANPRFEFWVEPGRYLVSQAGVLLARVTQIKRKSEVTFVGLETGMNSLLRPALYGSHHDIVNLTRFGDPVTMKADIVGPICEAGDVLGRSVRLAPAREGDVLLIANAGAYGATMSSRYNLREPAEEIAMDFTATG